MVIDKAARRRMDRVFAALADPTRRAMLERLGACGGEGVTAGELGRGFRISQPAASRHLRVLRRAGLVRKRVRGREHWCRIEAGPLREAAAWIERYRVFWEGQFEALDVYLKSGGSGMGRSRSREQGAVE